MELVIAEKPSVAQSIAAVIGAKSKKDGYLEGNGYLVSWCIGRGLPVQKTMIQGIPGGIMTTCRLCRENGSMWWVRRKRSSLIF